MGRPTGAKSGGGVGNQNTRNGLRAARSIKLKSSTTANKSETHTSASGQNKGDGGGKPTLDRSQINFPYDIRLSGLPSLVNIVTKGTPKVKKILNNECDYIMECRVCRNLFRSVPNFLTHKQNFCKRTFDATWSLGLSNLIQSGDASFSLHIDMDSELFGKLLSNGNSENDLPSTSTSSAGGRTTNNSRYASEFYEELSKKVTPQPSPLEKATPEPSSTPPTNNCVRVEIKPLVNGANGPVVVEQKVSCDPSNCDITSVHRNPVVTLPRDTAVLGPDGKVVYHGSNKGIDRVVERLMVKMKTLPDSEAHRLQGSCSKITCDICKTLFDSDKALRQHKRESLDCGKTWIFKPNAQDNQSSPETPAKRLKLQGKGESSSSRKSSSPMRLTKHTSSPVTELRRNSHKKLLQSTTKAKRTLALSSSPAKRATTNAEIVPGITFDEESSSYSCNRCSSSFQSKHEMSLHLALCTGVINYAFLRASEPPQERIGISVRHEFQKPPSEPTKNVSRKKSCDSQSQPSKSKVTELAPVSSVSHDTKPKVCQRSGGTRIEVNNNKECESEYDVEKEIAQSRNRNCDDECGGGTSPDSGVSSGEYAVSVQSLVDASASSTDPALILSTSKPRKSRKPTKIITPPPASTMRVS